MRFTCSSARFGQVRFHTATSARSNLQGDGGHSATPSLTCRPHGVAWYRPPGKLSLIVTGMGHSFPFGLFHVNSVTGGLANSDVHFLIRPPTAFDSSSADGNLNPSGRLTTIDFSPSIGSNSHAVRNRIVESRNLRTFQRDSP